MNKDNKNHEKPQPKEEKNVPLLLRIRMSWVAIAILLYILIHLAFIVSGD